MITKIEILSIIGSILGNSKQTGDNNYAFFCPYCNHYKKKLELNLETSNYHCWTCTPKRGGKNFYYLFKDLPKITSFQLECIKEYTKTVKVYKSKSPSSVSLPKEFRSLSREWNSIEYKHAMAYLKGRNITTSDIEKYNIGYSEEGEYLNRIIVPSHSSDGTLNYFISRAFFNGMAKYKNPQVSKNIVAFDSLISWNFPVVLCEGIFDAMAIKRNAIPLLGKNISGELKRKLIINKVKDIYICLDNDAKGDALDLAQTLLRDDYDRNIYLVNMSEKDPSEMGFSKMSKLIKDTPKFDFKNLIRMRLFE